MKKIMWVSRHPLSPAQVSAITTLHGADVDIVHNPAVFDDFTGLTDLIRQNRDSFVYAVAGAAHYLHAAANGCDFGVFENDPARRHDGQFGLKAVYHCIQVSIDGAYSGTPQLTQVWVNDNPSDDNGDSLDPVGRS